MIDYKLTLDEEFFFFKKSRIRAKPEEIKALKNALNAFISGWSQIVSESSTNTKNQMALTSISILQQFLDELMALKPVKKEHPDGRYLKMHFHLTFTLWLTFNQNLEVKNEDFDSLALKEFAEKIDDTMNSYFKKDALNQLLN